MEEGEIIILKLEEIPRYFDSQKKEMEQYLNKLNFLNGIIEDLYNKEKNFSDLQQKVNNIYETLTLYFNNETKGKELDDINLEMESYIGDYNKKLEEFKKEIEKLDLKTLEKIEIQKYLEEKIKPFFEEKIKGYTEIDKKLNQIFELAGKNIKNNFESLTRLLKTFQKIIEDKNDINFIKFYNDIDQHVRNIKDIIPNNIEDLLKLEKNKIKNLYSLILKDILDSKSKIRNFFIENRLLSENEINLLEEIYKLPDKEFEFNRILIELTKNLNAPEKEVQETFIGLSKKGLLTLKIFTE
ncbi:MAG: hypothetical protein QXD43_01550 [Candidatus Aenigmatarchaeota archaeon]